MATHQRADERLREWLSTSEYNQSDLAEILEVSRAAVSNWARGIAAPSEQHAEELDTLSQGAVPATLWPRRHLPKPLSRGAQVLQKAASRYGVSISRLADETGLPKRGLARWASNKYAPRSASLAEINRVLKTNLRPEDFQVQA